VIIRQIASAGKILAAVTLSARRKSRRKSPCVVPSQRAPWRPGGGGDIGNG